MHVYNVHCKHIILGASADNAYASFLDSFFDADLATRIILLEGPPFAREFRNLLNRFSIVQFPALFKKMMLQNDRSKPLTKFAEVDLIEFEVRPSDSASNIAHPTTPGSDDAVMTRKSSQTAGQAISVFDHDKLNDDKDVRSTNSSLDVELESVPKPKTSQKVVRQGPQPKNIRDTLRKIARQQLDVTPLSLDFGKVKVLAATELGVDSDFWGSNDNDTLYRESKAVIKEAVVSV